MWNTQLTALSITYVFSLLLFILKFLFIYFGEEDLPWANINCQSSSILYVGCLHNLADELSRSAPRVQTCKPQATEVEQTEL